MNFRSLRIACLAMLAAIPLSAAAQQPSKPYQSSGAPSATVQAPKPSALNAPVAPDLAEMRAMTASQLDEAGDKLRAAKDYLSALDCYREAIRKFPDPSYYNKIAITEIMLRHPDKAEKAARKAVRKDKTMAEAWNNLGVAKYLHGASDHKKSQTQDAIHDYQRAISLAPDNASFHNNMAAALMDLQEYDRGIAEYRKAFALDPGFFERTSENGISLRMSSPEDRARYSFVMARLFASSGDTERALHFLRAAMEEGYPKIEEVYRVKEFAPVLKDERFLALMKERPVAIR